MDAGLSYNALLGPNVARTGTGARASRDSCSVQHNGRARLTTGSLPGMPHRRAAPTPTHFPLFESLIVQSGPSPFCPAPEAVLSFSVHRLFMWLSIHLPIYTCASGGRAAGDERSGCASMGRLSLTLVCSAQTPVL